MPMWSMPSDARASTRRSWRRRGRALPRWAEMPRPCRTTTSGSGSPSASVASSRRRRPAPPKRRRSSSTESRPTNGAFWLGQTPIRSMNWSAGRPSAPTMSTSSSSSRKKSAGACYLTFLTLCFPTGGEEGDGLDLDRPRKTKDGAAVGGGAIALGAGQKRAAKISGKIVAGQQ